MSPFRSLVIYCVLTSGVWAAWSQLTVESAPLAIRRGELPNGLAYVVAANASGRGELCARLVVKAGSLDENDDERGFALLVQRLAADSTLRLAAPTLRNHILQFGGGSSPAMPSFTHMTHTIDLTVGGVARLDDVLSVFRQIADGLAFGDEHVRQIAARTFKELPPLDEPAAIASRQSDATLYRDERLLARDPYRASGLEERASPERLHAFYRRTYSPARMTLILVGPIDPTAAEKKISGVFSSLPAATESLPTQRAALASFSGVAPIVATISNMPPNHVIAEYVSIRPRQPDTELGRRGELIRSVAMRALDTRLRVAHGRDLNERLRTRPSEAIDRGFPRISLPPDWFLPSTYYLPPAPKPVYLSTNDYSSGVYPEPTRAYSILTPAADGIRNSALAVGSDGDWGRLVAFIESELRRVRNEGFTPREIENAISAHITEARIRGQPPLRKLSEALADEIALHAGEGRRWLAPSELLSTMLSLRSLSPSDVNPILPDLFPRDGSHIVVRVGPGRKPHADAVATTFTASARRAPFDRASLPPPTFNYATSHRAAPFRETRIDDLGLTLANFENGVRINFRTARDIPGRISVGIALPKSWADSPADLGGVPAAAAYAFLNSPLNAQSRLQIQELNRLRDIEQEIVFDHGNPLLVIHAPAEQLRFVFELLHTQFSELDLTSFSQSFVLADYFSAEERKLVDPRAIATEAALRLFTGDDTRVVTLPLRHSSMESLRGKYVPWLKEHILAAPLEIGVVGDIAAQHVLKVAATTVGTLRSRPSAPKPARPLAISPTPLRQELSVDLPVNVSVSSTVWPSTLPDTSRHDLAAVLAAEILRERLVTVLRDGFGITSSPEIYFHRDRIQRDFAFAQILTFFPATGVTQFTEASVRLAGRLATQGATQEELSRARSVVTPNAGRNLETANWWLRNVVCIAQSRPTVIEATRRYRTDLETLTLEEVNTAARMFVPDRAATVSLRPASVNAANVRPPSNATPDIPPR